MPSLKRKCGPDASKTFGVRKNSETVPPTHNTTSLASFITTHSNRYFYCRNQSFLLRLFLFQSSIHGVDLGNRIHSNRRIRYPSQYSFPRRSISRRHSRATDSNMATLSSPSVGQRYLGPIEIPKSPQTAKLHIHHPSKSIASGMYEKKIFHKRAIQY